MPEVSGRCRDEAKDDALGVDAAPGARKSERPGSAGVYGRDGSEREARACAMVLYCDERDFQAESPSMSATENLARGRSQRGRSPHPLRRRAAASELRH